MTPKILSINVSLPKEIDFEGQKVTTGIFKEPIEGRIMLRTLNLDGDKQADLTVHGGPDKAVYAYPKNIMNSGVKFILTWRCQRDVWRELYHRGSDGK